MSRSLRRPLTRLLLVVLALGAMAAVPTVAQATTVSSGSFTLLPRTSWFNYLAIFGGTIRPIGTASFNSTNNQLTTTLGGLLETTYVIDLDVPDAGAGRLSYAGGIEYTLALHGISVKLRDFSVVLDSETDTIAEVYALADYQAIDTGRLTGYVLTHIANTDLSGAGVFRYSASPDRHTWTTAARTLLLTTAGATIFNGGTNGSYRAGQEFGSILFSGSL